MGTHTPHTTANFKVLMIAAATISSAFFVGIQTAGEVHPVTLIEAGSGKLRGDMDDNGVVDVRDAIVILDIVQGYEQATPDHILGDPNGDGILTIDDARRILERIEHS